MKVGWVIIRHGEERESAITAVSFVLKNTDTGKNGADFCFNPRALSLINMLFHALCLKPLQRLSLLNLSDPKPSSTKCARSKGPDGGKEESLEPAGGMGESLLVNERKRRTMRACVEGGLG